MKRIATFLSIASLVLCVHQTYCAPKKELWPFWQSYNSDSNAKVDHSKWQLILSKGVTTTSNGVNLVRYPLLKTQYHVILKEYLNYLSSINILQYNKNEQLAYWVNLYNAITVDLVLEHLPINSIMDIKLSGLFVSGPWDHKVFQVNQRGLSLNDIEHRIIRPIWNDPKTHYVLNCASIGCPNLIELAYTGSNINRLLESAAKEYVNSKRGVSVKLDRLTLSRIYDWYASDFGSNESDIIIHLRKYAKPDLDKSLMELQSVSSYQYNWDLNCAGCE